MNSKEKENLIAYHLRTATKCKKYMMDERSTRMRTYYTNKAKQHLEAIRQIGLINLGIEL